MTVLRSRSLAMSWGLTICLGFIVLWPLISFEAKGFEAGIGNVVVAFTKPGIVATVLNTVALALGGLTGALVLGTILAWSALHLPRRVRQVGTLVPLVPMLIPSIASVIGWIFLLSPRVGYLNIVARGLGLSENPTNGPLNIYSLAGMIFVSSLIFASFVYMFVLTALRGLGAEYEEAASVCGASPRHSLRTIVLPQLRPALAYSGGIVFMLGLGQFSVPILLRGQSGIEVLSTRMFLLLDQTPPPFGEMAALGFPLILGGLLTVWLQRSMVGDVRRYITVGGKAVQSMRKPSWLAAAIVFVYGLVAVVLPLLALIYMSFSPFWTGRIGISNLTADNFSIVFSDDHVISALFTSVLAAVLTIVIILPFGYVVAKIVSGRQAVPRLMARILEWLLILPFAVPATLFGVSMLFAYSQSPFNLYGTRTIIVVAYCTTMIPYAVRLLTTNLVSFGPEQWEASSVSGARPLRTFLKVTIPLMRHAASATAAIVFILLLQEFAVSILVRSAGTQVIGSVLYDQFVGGSYPNVAVIALIMVFSTIVGVTVMLASGGTKALKQMGTTKR